MYCAAKSSPDVLVASSRKPSNTSSRLSAAAGTLAFRSPSAPVRSISSSLPARLREGNDETTVTGAAAGSGGGGATAGIVAGGGIIAGDGAAASAAPS